MHLFKKKRSKLEDETPNFWTSYADILAALLLTFILLLMIVIFDYKDVLFKTKTEIDSVTGLREQIVGELQTKFSGTQLKLKIDPQTGAIRFEDRIFFENNKYEIDQKGIDFLKEFVPAYISILLDEKFRDHISEIIIEGHACKDNDDSDAAYLYNLKLSQNRAAAVMYQIFDPEFPKFQYRETLKSKITANGRSFSNPILVNGVPNKDESRRVEFKFRLKDEAMMDALQAKFKE